jgi:hypothetical protein
MRRAKRRIQWGVLHTPLSSRQSLSLYGYCYILLITRPLKYTVTTEITVFLRQPCSIRNQTHHIRDDHTDTASSHGTKLRSRRLPSDDSISYRGDR